MAKKPDSKKKLSLLKKTQELTDIVERGSIEEQALSDAADAQGMAEDQHLTDLLSKEDEEWEKGAKQPSSKKGKAQKKRK
ncbi:MAG: hypothetical protein KGH49_01240 [Candidatus Micrarchaeota archaeon]|nr:hypothetical protein [Candidatus Micrarchaeota archaeon]